MKDKVSIIITCYNDKKFIEKSISSAIDQTYKEKEIIVVDDGSDKETKKILKSFEGKVDILIFQVNSGASASRNNGIKASSGKYILVLDGDDYFEPEFCEKAISVFETASDVILVTCHARWFWNQNNYQIYKPRGGGLENFLTNSAAIGNSMFLKKDWSEVGGYDEKMLKGWEDWEFFIRLHQYGGVTYVIPEILFHYRKRVNSRTTEANRNKYELLEYIYLKHEDLFKEHFQSFVKILLNKVQKEEKEKSKQRTSIDFKIGQLALWPLRKIKRIF